MQIYKSCGWPQWNAAQSIIQYNLYGLDIDKRATQLAYFSVMMKARQYDRRFLTRNLQPHVYATTGDADGENFGSILIVDDPDEMPEDPHSFLDMPEYEQKLNIWNYRYVLSQKYHVVVTNPPHATASGLNNKCNEFLRKNYPNAKSDLFAAFIERCLSMTEANSLTAMITQQAWMFLSSYENLRRKVMLSTTIENMVHLGNGAFGVADFGLTTFVLRNKYLANFNGTYFRLVKNNNPTWKEQAFLSGENRYTAKQDNFSKIPGALVAYWVSEKMYQVFTNVPSFSNFAEPRQGMATANNERFLRLWYEVKVNHEEKWFPTHKGGAFRR